MPAYGYSPDDLRRWDETGRDPHDEPIRPQAGTPGHDRGDDVDPDYYCACGLPWSEHADNPNKEPRPMFDPINLDCITDDPQELHELARVFNLLSAYCVHRANGMEARKAGRIELALTHERSADHAYQRLPEWARW